MKAAAEDPTLLEKQLRKASAEGRVEDVKLLLKQVSANAKNESGSTPLHEAAFAGHVEVCAVLLAHGAEAASLECTSKYQRVAGYLSMQPISNHFIFAGKDANEEILKIRKAVVLVAACICLCEHLPFLAGPVKVVSDATGSALGTLWFLFCARSCESATAGKLLDGLLAFEDPGEIDLIRANKVTTVDQLHGLIQSTQTGSSTLVLATFVAWIQLLLGGLRAKSFCEEAGIRFIDVERSEVMSPLLDDFSSFFEDTALGLPGSLDERKVSNLVSKEFLGMVEAVKWGQKHISGLNPQVRLEWTKAACQKPFQDEID
ncbi:Ankyrin repeat and KH domain-containing protein mask [Symbiodinium microadriaticum]|uniref:Ankyrin repeat and KH domain-containing protein mask n=1 Tax=Symbiodinium microadriaticum TaxID=2951 RepID=A0A1Q9D399_SYMMI|nr:Ankyrin repeat and KH domain-containing protein mask [Symbiodinium microadriaticum]